MDEVQVANALGASTETMMITAIGVMHVLTPKVTQVLRIFIVDNTKLNYLLPTIIGLVVGLAATLGVQPESWMQGMYIYICAVSGSMSSQAWHDAKSNGLNIKTKSKRNGKVKQPKVPQVVEMPV
jgi:hypothetical protein